MSGAPRGSRVTGVALDGRLGTHSESERRPTDGRSDSAERLCGCWGGSPQLGGKMKALLSNFVESAKHVDFAKGFLLFPSTEGGRAAQSGRGGGPNAINIM